MENIDGIELNRIKSLAVSYNNNNINNNILNNNIPCVIIIVTTWLQISNDNNNSIIWIMIKFSLKQFKFENDFNQMTYHIKFNWFNFNNNNNITR